MELAALFNKYKNNILNIAIIILALSVSGKIYQGGAKKMDLIQQEKEAALKKNGIVAEIARLETEIVSYKSLVGKKHANAVINTLRDIAKEAGVKITLIRPAGAQRDKYYTELTFDLSVSAVDYHALGKFISKIESNKEIYIVESMEIKPGAGSQETIGIAVIGSVNKELAANIRLSTVEMAD